MMRFFDANKKLLARRRYRVIVFLAIPLVVENKLLIHLAILGMLYAIVASNWDLTLGYAGVFNFAHLAFFGIGRLYQRHIDRQAGPLALDRHTLRRGHGCASQRHRLESRPFACAAFTWHC